MPSRINPATDVCAKPKRVSFRTFGCRLNQAETARMAATFIQAGYAVVPFGEPCDVSIIHSCAVTGTAETESLRTARAAKKREPGTRVVLAGCVAETAAAEPVYDSGIDLIVGQKDKMRIPDLLNTPPPAGSAPVHPCFETTRALLKVQDGCDFFCAYCIVPFARGRATSRPFREVLEEAAYLADNGFKELVLTGANVGAYRDGNRTLLHLLEAVEALDNVKRVRLSSVEMSTVEYAMIHHMSASTKLCHYLHIPLQSGDDTVLKAMNRRYTSLDYRAVISRAVDRIPDLGLSTDIITGFPGETDAAFAATVQMVKNLPFSNLHVFPFSSRRLTRAAAMDDRPSKVVAKSRATELIELGSAKRSEFARKWLGKTVEVLLETAAADSAGGWSGEYLPVTVTGSGFASNTVVKAVPHRWDGSQLIAKPAAPAR